MTLQNVHDVRLTRKEAAHFIKRSYSTLEKWGHQKKNLTVYKVGGKAEYDLAELIEFKKGKQVF